MRRPTDVLREEHELILEALEVLSAGADCLKGGGEVADQWWSDMIGWLRGFADRGPRRRPTLGADQTTTAV